MAHQHQTPWGQTQTIISQNFLMSTQLRSENPNQVPFEQGLHFTPCLLANAQIFKPTVIKYFIYVGPQIPSSHELQTKVQVKEQTAQN